MLKHMFQHDVTSLFINFEDPRLDGFEVGDFYKIEQIASETGKSLFIFDEIQNIPEWERYIRSAQDRGLRIYITGSNAAMLSRELGTRLTGRYRPTEIFPFSYSEFLLFCGLTAGPMSFRSYLDEGGFPEFLAEKETEYLRTLLKDIIIRDISLRRKIRNEHVLIRLATYLMSNTGKEFSYNNMTKMLEIKSVRTTIDFCDFLHESYLFDFIPRFSFSTRQQQSNPKKAYAVDTGIAKANSLTFSKDEGRFLENAAYLQLRRNSKRVEYFKDENTECDFIVREELKITEALQVCWHLDEENVKREVMGLKNAMKITGASNGYILTFDQEDELDKIPLIPAWKWMTR
jgi:predicted AAA+ superfamily ATPase